MITPSSQNAASNPMEGRLWLLTLAITLAFAASRAVAVTLSGIPLPWAPATRLMGLSSLPMLTLGCFYLWVRPDIRLAAPLLAFGMVLAGSVAAGEASDLPFYFGRSYPMVDQSLAAADQALGFCWPCYAAWFNAHPTLYAVGTIAYGSIIVQAPLAAIGLALSRQVTRLCIFIVGCNIVLGLTSLVAYRFPAFGAYTFYGFTKADHPDITMMFSDDMRATIAWLREARFKTFPDGLTTGLVSFPSFHAAMALVYGWAAWTTSYRWPVLVLNVAMVLMTPIQGSHYLMDVFAGFAVAAVSIASAACLPRLCRTVLDRRPTQAPR